MRIHNQTQCNKNIAKDKEKNLENKKQCITYKGIPSMISSLLLSRKLKINARRHRDIVLKVLRRKKKKPIRTLIFSKVFYQNWSGINFLDKQTLWKKFANRAAIQKILKKKKFLPFEGKCPQALSKFFNACIWNLERW